MDALEPVADIGRRSCHCYIAYKRSLGMGFRTEAVSLRAFIKAVGDVDLEAVQPLAFRRFLDGNGPLTAFWFSTYHSLSAFYRYRLVRKYVQKAMASCPSLARKKISPHIIPHTTATHLLRAGVDINTIRAWLGHVSIDTTNIYAEVDLERKAKMLTHTNALITFPATTRPWRDNPTLMDFLRSL